MKIKNPKLANVTMRVGDKDVIFDAEGVVDLPKGRATALLATPGFSDPSKTKQEPVTAPPAPPAAPAPPKDLPEPPAAPMVDPEGDFVGEGGLASDGAEPSVTTAHLDDDDDDDDSWPPEYATEERVAECTTKAMAMGIRDLLSHNYEVELPEWGAKTKLKTMKKDLLEFVTSEGTDGA